MSELRRLWRRMLAVVRRDDRDDEDARREVAAHLQLLEDQFLAEGREPDEARRLAHAALGGVTQTVEVRRDARTLPWIEDLRADLRLALRGMYRAPAFSLTVIATLALGIGLNAAVYSVVRAVLLRPLPYPSPERIVRIVGESLSTGDAPVTHAAFISRRELDDLRNGVRDELEGLGAYASAVYTMSGIEGRPAARVSAVRISPPTLKTLGVTPMAGRLFEPQEEAIGLDGVVVLGHALWMRAFDGARDVIGRPLRLDGRTYRVVGVMPASFHFPDREAELWVPFVWHEYAVGVLTGRLASSASAGAVNDDVTRILRISRMDPTDRAMALGMPPPPPPPPPPAGFTVKPAFTPPKPIDRTRFRVLPIQEQWTAPVRPALVTLTIVVSGVLLLAFVNTLGLLSARAAARRNETAMRIALGARTGRLLRQSLTESSVLALAGAAAGVALAWGVTLWFRTLSAGGPRAGASFVMPALDDVAIDAGVVEFTFGVALLIGVICGVMGAVRANRPLASNRPRRWHAALIGVEIAVATMLAISGGLLVRSFAHLSSVQPGFDAERVLTFQVALPPGRATLGVYDELAERLSRVPGVAGAGFADEMPISAGRLPVTLSRTPPPPTGDGPPPPPPPPGPGRPANMPDLRVVSRGLLDALGVRIVEGRGFDERDIAGATPVLLINQTIARSGVLGPQPVGQFVYASGLGPRLVIGVVSDVRQFGLDEAPGPQAYVDYRQSGELATITESRQPYVLVRAVGEPRRLLPALQAAVRGLEPLGTVDRASTLAQLIERSMAPRWFYTVLALALALTAAALALAGVHGMVAFVVSQRIQEIGLHVALGATRAQVMLLVARQVLVFGMLGAAAGVAGAATATRVLAGLIFGLSSYDPVSFALVPALFVLTACVAAAIPARRALSVDPLVALRQN